MKILAVCRCGAETLAGSRSRTGINKSPLSGPVLVDEHGIVGDAVCNRKHHGGPDQAILIEGGLTLDWWRHELSLPLSVGAFGENVVIEGLDNRDLCVGDQLAIGPVRLEITSPRIPCATLARKMGDMGFARRYSRAARPGGYARVLSTGVIEVGQTVNWLPYSGDRIPLAEMMENFSRVVEEKVRQRYLCVPISQRWREKLAG